MLEYNVLLAGQHTLEVDSVAVLLRPAADRPSLTGAVRRTLPGDRRYLDVVYTVVRLWEQPVETLLAGGLGTLPLTPLGAVRPGEVPTVVRAVGERLNREASGAEGDVLWLCTYILAGLRYAPETLLPVFERVRAMQESATYQAIVREGEARGLVRGARLVLLRLGEARFGRPTRGRARRSKRSRTWSGWKRSPNGSTRRRAGTNWWNLETGMRPRPNAAGESMDDRARTADQPARRSLSAEEKSVQAGSLREAALLPS